LSVLEAWAEEFYGLKASARLYMKPQQFKEDLALKIKRLSAAAAALALGMASSMAVAQESEGYMLSMTKVYLQPLSWMAFGSGLQEFIECNKNEEVEGSWSTWVDQERPVVWFVSRMDNWAERDESAGLGPCYPVLEEKMRDSVRYIETEFARYMTDWNTEDDTDPGVVRLHQFSVDEGAKFRRVVSEITDVLKEAEYEHQGDWFEMLGEDGDEVNFFVVSEFDNFAELDADRQSAGAVLEEAIGEDAADALWERMWDTLADDGEGYDTVMLRHIPGWSYDGDSD
jgi:hypothetical protein